MVALHNPFTTFLMLYSMRRKIFELLKKWLKKVKKTANSENNTVIVIIPVR